jgi:hypothetical protein
MKTTLNLRDDLVRRAKARAALRGQPLARYIEEGLEQRLDKEEVQPIRMDQWLESLPEVPVSAAKSLHAVVDADDFREIDEGMWQ